MFILIRKKNLGINLAFDNMGCNGRTTILRDEMIPLICFVLGSRDGSALVLCWFHR